MTTELQELPEQGEIVLATIAKITDHGAYVSLDEYNSAQGFLHISEIAPGWIRSIGKYVKEGEKKVLLVKKVNPERSDIDLSLKQVTNDQKKKKLLEVKRYEKGRTIIQNIKEKANLSVKEVEKLEENLYSKYDSIYDAFLEIARKGTSVLGELKLSKKIISAIEEISSNIRLPSVEIRGVLEVTSNRPDGVEVIIKSLTDSIKNEKGKGVTINYLGAPKYRISVSAQDFKSAEKTLKPILEDIQRSIEKKKGTFRFTREESKKKGES